LTLLATSCTQRNPATVDQGLPKQDSGVVLDGAAGPEASIPDVGATPEGPIVTPDQSPPVPDQSPPVPDLPGPIQDLAPLPDLTPPPPDLPLPPDQALPPDQGTPPKDLLAPCKPPGFASGLVNKSDKTGDWALVLEPKTSYKPITISGAKAKQAAAAFDFNQAWQQVAGFVVSVPSSATDPATEAAGAVKAMSTLLYGSPTTDAAGTKVKTHDGFAAMTMTTVSVKMASTSDVSLVRNTVISALLGVSSSNLSGLPGIFGAPNLEFIIRFTTVLRSDGRVVVVGAVTDKASDADLSKKTHIISQDIGGGSGLALAGKLTSSSCETHNLSKPPTAKVDFIWVIDESGSMAGERANLSKNAATFFSLAASNGLDFRMGVTNVVNPNGSYKAAVGRFCSKISTSATDMGGTDRFLGPTEQKTFAACILNPPGYEQGAEYGVVNAHAAVQNHLPRAGNKPDKLRTGAQVVIIVVTDEVPQSVNSTIGSSNFNKCTLPSTNQTNLDAKLKTYVDYFSGTKNAETKVDYFHGVAGVCSNKCSAQVAHGYKELASKFNGKIHDVCAADLTNNIKTIINQIKASASNVKLTQTPISASLRVALNGQTVKRGLLNGFNYMKATNSLVFYGTFSWPKGSSVTVTYERFK